MGFISRKIRKDIDEIMTQKIKAFEGDVIASNDQFQLYAKCFEVNGYYFLGLQLLGPLKINTHNGCTFRCSSNNNEYKTISDTMEIHSDYSESMHIGITTFDIDLEDEFRQLIASKNLTTISLTFSKSFFSKKTISFIDIDHEVLYSIIHKID